MPSDHATVFEHKMELPNNEGKAGDPDRRWKGQKFVRYRKKDQGWRPHRVPGFETIDTSIAEGTQVSFCSDGILMQGE